VPQAGEFEYVIAEGGSTGSDTPGLLQAEQLFFFEAGSILQAPHSPDHPPPDALSRIIGQLRGPGQRVLAHAAKRLTWIAWPASRSWAICLGITFGGFDQDNAISRRSLSRLTDLLFISGLQSLFINLDLIKEIAA